MPESLLDVGENTIRKIIIKVFLLLNFLIFLDLSANGHSTMKTKSILAALASVAAMSSYGAIYITEIMYNPGPSFPDSTHEFVEIYNTPGGGFVDIQDWTIDDGGTPQSLTAAPFVLAPGSFLVIAELPLATFNTDYNVALTTAQYVQVASFPGLNNTGDTINIKDAGSTVRATISYDDVGPWPSDVAGHSISFNLAPDLAPPGAYQLPGNWSLSDFKDQLRSNETGEGGWASPGRLDVVPEPSSLTLLGLGAMTLVRLRRKKR